MNHLFVAHRAFLSVFLRPKYVLFKNLDKILIGDHIQPKHLYYYITALQKAICDSAREVKIDKPISPHTFRHRFATHLLEASYDISTGQELWGHKDIKTTMIFTYVLNLGPKAARSP